MSVSNEKISTVKHNYRPQTSKCELFQKNRTLDSSVSELASAAASRNAKALLTRFSNQYNSHHLQEDMQLSSIERLNQFDVSEGLQASNVQSHTEFREKRKTELLAKLMQKTNL